MPCLCGGRRAQDEARRGCGMAWHVVSLRRSSSHKRETRAIFVLTRKGTFHKQRQKTRKECRSSLLGGDGCGGKQVGRMERAEFSGDGGGNTFAAEGRVREVKGRRTGRDFRSRGGRIVFFCGFGKRKPPERERLGLKLEWARLMTDQFCAAGSQAQRGAACARVPDFPLCGGWEWWGVAAGHWAPGSGHCWEPALGGCGRCRPSPGGAVEPLLGAGAIQPYKLETGRRSTEEQHPIPTLTRIRGGEGPLLPPSTPYTGPIQIDGRGVPSGILEAWSSSLSFQPSFRVGAIVDLLFIA